MAQVPFDIDTLPFLAETDAGESVQTVCLTVLAHPEANMVGARAFLADYRGGWSLPLSRLAPDFEQLDGKRQPLADTYVSRQPTTLAWRPDGQQGGAVLLTPPPESKVLVAGEPLLAPRLLPEALLHSGVAIELSNRTAVLLHLRAWPTPQPDLGLVGDSEALGTIREQIQQAAPFDVPVLLTGETGVGKELVARALHQASPRRQGPWVAVNVAEIKADTAASVLFGHVRGAFTGATQDHDGLFAQADGGTLFLDEIGEMAPDVQAMLLRVVETGELLRLGAKKGRQINVRVIAASDRSLDENGPLRAPLFYRLAGFRIHMPPLRERLDDLGPLLLHFRDEELRRNHLEHLHAWFPAPLVARLARHTWPGNARELRNLVQTLVIGAQRSERLGKGFDLESWLSARTSFEKTPKPPIPIPHANTPPEFPTLTHTTPKPQPGPLTDEALATALARNHWSLVATARQLGIARSTLYLAIERSPTLRKAADVPVEELERLTQETGGRVDQMAELLRVSPRGLRIALRSAGIAVRHSGEQHADDWGGPDA